MVLVSNAAVPKHLERFAKRKSLLANVANFLDSGVQKLLVRLAGIEANGAIDRACLEIVGLDAPHVVRIRLLQVPCELPEVRKERLGNCCATATTGLRLCWTTRKPDNMSGTVTARAQKQAKPSLSSRQRTDRGGYNLFKNGVVELSTSFRSCDGRSSRFFSKNPCT